MEACVRQATELGEEDEQGYEMTVQLHDVKDTRRTTQLQGQSALSACCAEESEEDQEEEEEEEEDEAVDTAVFMSIDDHKAASAQERLQQSVEEADSDDPFGFAPEEGEQERIISADEEEVDADAAEEAAAAAAWAAGEPLDLEEEEEEEEEIVDLDDLGPDVANAAEIAALFKAFGGKEGAL